VVERWTTDEHRLGLKPILRRVWARRGQRVLAVVHHRDQWRYLLAFVCPQTGRTHWWLLPTINLQGFEAALAAFAQAVGARAQKRIVLVLDRAGGHASPLLPVPEGVHLVWLPPSSPELQPAERLWPLSNEPLANRSFADLAELEAVQAQRGLALQAQAKRIRAVTLFHWWPLVA
jgi:transposase